jgi:hypothetical protein
VTTTPRGCTLLRRWEACAVTSTALASGACSKNSSTRHHHLVNVGDTDKTGVAGHFSSGIAAI